VTVWVINVVRAGVLVFVCLVLMICLMLGLNSSSDRWCRRVLDLRPGPSG
jgi:hypothetical protein